ncbi:uncharacterized protein LOC131893222 [Tigriopus californicus]|uniref:uncharacterized protein LOC131893222 n=1 Tax=Tigriopus californicus TaxID=6832 RepID=UPI0027DA5D19|nr:uncharacterized protein LOC131893222 [Tigriopus californicus]
MYLFSWIEIDPGDRQSRFDFVDALSWLFCVVSQQGYSKTPSTLSGKFLFLVGFLTITLVFQGFSANVMTILSRSETIDSLEELIELNTMNIHQSVFPPFQKELEDSKKEIAQKLVRKIESSKGSWKCENTAVSCDESIMNQIVFQKDPNMAFVGLEIYLRDKYSFAFNMFENLPCSLKWFKVPMGRQSIMYGLRKHLPQKRKLDAAFFRYRETGLLGKTIQKFKPKSPHCASLNELQSKVVSFHHVKMAYFLLVLGYLVAAILFLAEKFSFENKTNKESETFNLKN